MTQHRHAHQLLGPDGFRKIAIVGSAPSSMQLGPYNDPSWAIWGCSPGVYGVIPRSDVWWEIHRWEPPAIGQPNNAANKPWFSPEYVQFLKQHPGCVMLAGPDPDVENPVPEIVNGWRFPFEDYVARFGPYHFTSSMAWMIAHAIEVLIGKRAQRDVPEHGEAIGLWGVDMAADEEYSQQRPGCQHFLGLARKMGIKVILPPESDLAQPPTLYGISEYHPRHQKLLVRQNEMRAQEAQLVGQLQELNNRLMVIRGALSNMKYIFSTWIDEMDPGVDFESAVSMAGVLTGRPDPKDGAIEQFGEAQNQKNDKVSFLESEVERLAAVNIELTSALEKKLAKRKVKPRRR